MTEMDKKYNPNEVEKGRYNKWLEQDLFKPNGDQKAKPYSIVIPPPNVTGKLHLGHAWDTTLQDIIIRQKRMQGFDTLWLPGMDHAGIATQAKVEAKLKEEGVSRYDLGREKFVEKVWEWKDDFSATIKEQWGKLGLSLDYSRERFTLDQGLSDAVKRVFVDLYNKGLIYRGEYIINWDPQARTALSDIEVVHEDDKGAFYYLKYPFVDGTTFDGKDYIEIATTRPETMMGDTAVAVHPNDSRYQDLVGKKVLLPLANREIPIIADEYVDPEFGTGMVKITPAHDPNDFLVGNRHNLQRINTMNEDATMNENAGKYEGLDRFEARKRMVEDLDQEGYLLKVEPIVHAVGHSERTGVQVEARLSTQWFVKMKPLAEQAIKAQKGKDKSIFWPARFEHQYLNWMENIHDWVISRQLWWGHRIPAWYHKETGEVYVGEEAPKDIENWEQDPDVLDTWFSSALWPFSTMGWPDLDSPDYKRYFPTDTLVTGYDIIPFWVARMLFQSIEFTGKKPFKNVVLHGLIRDEQGRKMSKSLGNGIDPMEVIDKYGADALRWFLISGTTLGQDMRFDYKKMDASWNFINKIWNASRFVIMNLDGVTKIELPSKEERTLADNWILSRLNSTVSQVLDQLDKFNFGEAGRSIYDFIWSDFCDWYIELSKADLTGDDVEKSHHTKQVLAYVLDQILRLIHPFMPFVSEKIWLTMPTHEGESLVVAKYPEPNDDFQNPEIEKQMSSMIELITSVRGIRAEAGAPLSKPIEILIQTNDEALQKMFTQNNSYIERLVNPKQIEINSSVEAPELSKIGIISNAKVYIPLADLVDVEVEKKKLENQIKKFESEILRAKKKLANEKFIQKAPAELVEQEKQKVTDNTFKLNSSKESLAALDHLSDNQ
ncbi:valine--tRNA ligase [Xylocopilactobacillus apis]|uniref:Valine--tRNA ligase n=1 Tax=Xylocopilactobacillus apis TaxID=2932183 RepID=A0AAU9D3D4_9LACO|nr:valine--tRNA ligase [Xylocopilactobacillus apis]BDR55915.1 valine--tRNA ligase [Xylocopilactobacillus apis]